MASQTAAADEAQTATVEKEVTIIGYGADPDMSARAFAGTFDPEGRDFTEREESDYTRHYLTYYDADEGERVQDYLSEDAYQTLLNTDAFDPENDDGVDLKREVENTVGYAHDSKEAVSAAVNEIFEALKEEDPESLEDYYLNEYGPYVGDEVMNKLVTFGGYSVTRQRVLVHQSEREESDDRFETDDERPAVQFTVTIESDEEEVAHLSDEVVGYFMDRVARHDAIEKVRVSDCMEKVERQGDCFDL